MKNIVKPILSTITIGVFLVFAFASIGPDKSTNTSVAISNRMEKPEVAVQLTIDISFKNKAGEPIKEAFGSIFIVHQTVKKDTTCTYDSYPEDLEFYTDMNGYYGHSGITLHHSNSEDLYRVEVVIPKTAIYNEVRKVQVLKYSNAAFTFNLTGIRLSEL